MRHWYPVRIGIPVQSKQEPAFKQDRNQCPDKNGLSVHFHRNSHLADFLANMIEKYAGQMELDTLPDPRRQSRLLAIEEMYRKYMRLSAQARQAA